MSLRPPCVTSPSACCSPETAGSTKHTERERCAETRRRTGRSAHIRRQGHNARCQPPPPRRGGRSLLPLAGRNREGSVRVRLLGLPGRDRQSGVLAGSGATVAVVCFACPGG